MESMFTTDDKDVSMKQENSFETPTNERQNISFKFMKQGSRKFTGNKLEENTLFKSDRSNSAEVVKKKMKKELVIPMKKNTRTNLKPSSTNGNGSEDLNELAVKEILKESAMKNEDWEKREFQHTTMIPLLSQKKKEDLNAESEPPEETSIEKYEEIPISDFGRAVLRGLGLKNEELEKVVETKERPSWLGMGASAFLSKKQQQTDDKEELKIAKGTYVHIVNGQYKESYGQVESLDPELCRIFIKLSNDEMVSVNELYVEAVTKETYKKECRTLNQSSYEEYQKSQEKQRYSSPKPTHDEGGKENGHTSHSSKDKDDVAHYHTKKSGKKHKHSKQEQSEYHFGEKEQREKPWICSQLRVRFVNKQFKNGKYYNQKMIVEDVFSPESCACKTEDGRYLEGISSSMLETVVPRSNPAYVMIVQGKYRGQLAAILNRDKDNYIATVQFLSDREKVTKLDYDSVCEYVGDISSFD